VTKFEDQGVAGPSGTAIANDERRRRLRDAWLNSPAPRTPTIPSLENSDPAPLSAAQRGLWLVDQLEPGRPNYNVPLGWRLQGPLNVDALRGAVRELGRRHGAVRTAFRVIDGEPRAVEDPAAELELEFVELVAQTPAAREAEARALATTQAAQGFDLTSAPLARLMLAKVAQDDHVFLMTVHHIVADAWSVDILARELALLYAGYVDGVPAALGRLPITYADFARWEWQQGDSDARAKQLEFWREHLRGLPPTHGVPTDHARAGGFGFRGGYVSFRIPAETNARLGSLARQEQATQFMVLLAAFYVLLARYSRRSDAAVAAPVAGRAHPELESVVGFFANTLVLRGDMSGDPTFRELFRRVRSLVLDAFAHEDFPFERLVAELEPAGERGRAPLAQIAFGLQPTGSGGIALPGLKVQNFEGEHVPARFDLALSMVEQRGDLIGAFHYDAELFERSTVGRMATHFCGLIEAIAADPEERIAKLAMASEGERDTVLKQWNATQRPYALLDVHELFEAQVRRAGSAPAVISGSEVLTYEQLNRRANALAHRLRERGVGPEVIVGVHLRRSPELLVAILAVLKAGGAYLPLDPAYPFERLALMIDDAKPLLVVTEEHFVESLPKAPPPLLVSATNVADTDADLHMNVPLQCPAYVIYTSGSTGVPKGVVVTRAGAANLAAFLGDWLQLATSERVALFSSISFDASFWELSMALSRGCALVIIDVGVDGAVDLEYEFRESGVSVATLPPSSLRTLNPHALDRLRIAIAAGERCPADIAERWGARGRFINAYGPTETTVCATVADPPTIAADGAAIGQPIANVRTYVVDGAGGLAPVGIAGELAIGGVGVSRGYLGKPALTATRFVPNPFDGHGDRMYMTGDICRYRGDGSLEFLDREDLQIKLRGYRVELGEVESALARHPDVGAVAVAVEGDAGLEQLVAYVAPAGDACVRSEELFSFLCRTLPGYMVPAAIVQLDDLPLTSSGKIDRASLQRREEPSEGLLHADEPRTLTERTVAGVWAAAFGRDRIGVHENFFQLGGHSLLATQVIARLRDEFATRVPVRALFDGPTISEVAAVIDELRATEGE
jgi:pristinamycin I synthase-3/4